MKAIRYNVERIEQGLQDCLQTNVLQLLRYKGYAIHYEEISEKAGVYQNAQGELLGSSIGHMASFLLGLGLEVTIHTCDVEIFDPSWNYDDTEELLRLLDLRKGYIRHTRYGESEINTIIDGYKLFIKDEGKIRRTVFSEKYLYSLLALGPFLAVVNYQFLNQESKFSYDTVHKSPIKDSIQGYSVTHVLTVIGYEEGVFAIADTDPLHGRIRQLPSDLLVGSIYMAQADFDSMAITIQ